MKMSDDATGVVTAAVSAINPIAGLALTAGEKLVTGIIKGAHAVEEEKKREGVKHLDPKTWLSTIWYANTPEWANKKFSDMYKDWKKDAPKREAAKKQKKAEAKAYKQYKKDVWKHGTAKEKAKLFFFDYNVNFIFNVNGKC